MEFTLEKPLANSIISFDDGKIKLAHSILETPCVLSKNYHNRIQIKNISEINTEKLIPFLHADNIKILIIGVGEIRAFAPPKQQVEFAKIGVSIEVMSSRRSACHSYNLLLCDFRAVGLLLL